MAFSLPLMGGGLELGAASEGGSLLGGASRGISTLDNMMGLSSLLGPSGDSGGYSNGPGSSQAGSSSSGLQLTTIALIGGVLMLLVLVLQKWFSQGNVSKWIFSTIL